MGTFKKRLAMLLAAAMLFTSVPYMEVAAADDSTPAVEETTEGSTEGSGEETPAPASEAGGNEGENNTPDAPVQDGEGAGSEGGSQTTDPEVTVPVEGENTQDPENVQNTDPETPAAEVPEETATDEPTDAVVKAESIRIVQQGKDTAPTKVNVGSTVALEVVAEPEGAVVGAVVWSSSDETVATVTEEGVVKGITGTTGTVTITARAADDDSLVAELSLQSYAGKWKKVNKKWKFVLPNGKYAKSKFVTIDGKKYYIGSDQYMQTGWFHAGKNTYYANGSGEVQYGWKSIKVTEKVKGKKKSVARNYYFDPKTGVLAKGWKTLDGRFYYFAGNGKNQTTTGWQKLSKVWYYMVKDEDGHIYAATGWKQIKGKWYYLDPSEKLHGRMKTGWFTETVEQAATTAADTEAVEGEITEEGEEQTASEPAAAGSVTRTYYFNSTGASVTGIQTISKKKYVFVKETDGKGVLAEDGWTNVGTDWYYVDPETHVPATGQTDIDDQTYYFDAKTGIAKTGWIDLTTKKTTGTGKKKKTTYTYKYYYYLDDGTGKGVLQKNAWVDEGDKHYYAGEDGKLVSGDKEIDGKFYNFDAKSGKAKSGIITVGSKTYLYKAQDDTGRPYRFTETGKTMYDGKPYFIDDDGSLAKDRFIKDGEDYYYYNSTYQIATGWAKIALTKDNVKMATKWYYFDPDNGKMVTGWLDYKNQKCYLDPETGIMVTGAKTIDGDPYYFNGSGYMQKGVVAIGSKYYAYSLETGILVTDPDATTTTIEWKDEAGNTWKVNPKTGEITNYNKKLGAMDKKAQGASSSTNYLILVNKSTHILGIYERSGGRWVRTKTWACHTADNKYNAKTGRKNVTPSGKWTVTTSPASRMETYNNRGSSRATGTSGILNRDFDGSSGFYCTYISGGFFIHSLLYTKGTRLKTLGKQPKSPLGGQGLNDTKLTGGGNKSHGCVRVNFNNAIWVFEHMPKNTKVWVY